MASTSSPRQQYALLGLEPPNKRRKVEESSRLFDVFINHRGPDVKLTLATQLYNSLKDLHIKPFLDSEEKELGDSFPSTIETAITSASVHIAILSKAYAQSAWCLAELVLMLQSKAKIIPVFYQVKPSDLRYIEKGVYAEAFLQYVEKSRYLDKIEEWKKALQQVSYTAGYECESDCKDIVSAVEMEVKRTQLLHVAKHPVGLHKLVKDFERKCLDKLVDDFESQRGMEKANVVGIFGMGGVGKTTLSKELFNQKRSEYSRASFLFDVREAFASGKLPSLQSQLLKDIFCEDRSFLSSEEGASFLRDRFKRSSSFSFLIVLDNIDHAEQLDALLVMDVINKPANNLVIITTRDAGVLVSAGIDIGYHLKGLDKEGAKELFCLHAFNQPLPLVGYEGLVQDFVSMCRGLPLSIIVLGRHVFGRAEWYWGDILAKVKDTLPEDIKRRLKISIDTLNNVEKQIFMDVACFFIGESITKAMTVWKGSGWRARHALETLKEKCLVEQVEVRYLNWNDLKWESDMYVYAFSMHDHLRDLGREMANELNHPRRVWHPQHLKALELKGFRSILAETKGRCFHSILDESIRCEITYFLGESEDGSDTSLLWLQLEYLKYKDPFSLNSDINSSIFPWIPLENLQCLRISYGRFQKLWQSNVQAPSNLRELQIHDTVLEEIPELLGKSNKLEKLVLHAKDIQFGIWSLLESLRMNLRSLKMVGSALAGELAYNDTVKGTSCVSLAIYGFKLLWEGQLSLIVNRTVMPKIEKLEINSCDKLQNIMLPTTLNKLDVRSCRGLQRVAAGNLTKLTSLIIKKCHELEKLPSLARVGCLEKIQIDSCEKLHNIVLPTTVISLSIQSCRDMQRVAAGDFTNLTCLIIKKCPALEELPSFARVSCLEKIEIDSCEKLQNIMLPTAVISLSIQSCKDLQRVVAGELTKLSWLIIKNCPALEEFPSLAKVSCSKEIEISTCEKLQNIMLPTTLIGLSVQNCRDLQRIAGIDDLAKLRCLVIKKCPVLEELPSLAGSRCLVEIEVDSCEKLQNISGVEELRASKHTKLQYCSNTFTRNCIQKLKSLPSARMDVIGRAADGAESSLNGHLFSDANIGFDTVIEIGSDNTFSDWSGVSLIIGCFVVVIDSSANLRDLNRLVPLEYDDDYGCYHGIKLREGEWIITLVAGRNRCCSCEYKQYYERFENALKSYGVMKKGLSIRVLENEEWKCVGVLSIIVDRLLHL